jgi:hypothetical protein
MVYLEDRSQIFTELKVAFIFDFNSKDTFDKVKAELSKEIGESVITNHHFINTTGDFQKFEIQKRYDGAGNLYRFSTPFMPFLYAKTFLGKVLSWIDKNGETHEGNNLYVVIGTDRKSPLHLRKMNFTKFIMLFNEEKILKDFPRQNHVFSRPVKKLLSLAFNGIDELSPIRKNFAVEYAGPFSNYLVVKYFGGKNYQKKKTLIFSGIDDIMDALVNSIKNPQLSVEENDKLRKFKDEQLRLFNAVRNFEVFKQQFPNISFTIDLNSHVPRVNSFFSSVRNKLLEIVRDGDLHNGHINYDSDQSKFQIKEANLTNSFYLNSIDILECKVGGMLADCDIFESELDNCYVNKCNLFSESKAVNSYLMDSYVNSSSVLKDCHFSGKNGIMIGSMAGGVFENGKINNLSRISNDTRVLEYEKIK